MTRYYYLIEDGVNVVDDMGSEHWTASAAYAEAVRILAELLPSKTADLFDGGLVRVTVRDQDGLLLFTLECTGAKSPDFENTLLGGHAPSR